jgi:catechol 2,3-dioxygenase-like lactoylglutathione lyase family enzyme
MAAGPIDRVFISVSNLDTSLALYRDWAGMKVVAKEDLSPGEIQQLFKLPARTEAHAVLLANETQTTLLELIEFRPHSGIPIRQKTNEWDYGIYDIAFSVEGLAAIYRELTSRGFGFVSPPVTYNPFGAKVREAILLGPDNVHAAHIERVPEPDVALPARYLRMADSAQLVESVDEAIAFYGDILELAVLTKQRLPTGMVDEILGVPKQTDATMVFMNKKGASAPVVEFLELSVKGKSLAAIARPPNLGVFMLSFQVDNLDSTLEMVNERGYRVLSGPVHFSTPVHGKVRAVTVEAPAGVMVELFDK